MIVEPIVNLPTDGHRIQVFEAGRVLVANDEIRLIAQHRVTAHEQPIVGGRGQRLGQQYAALQIVDVVIEHGAKIQYAGYDAGGFVPNLDTHALGAGKHVLTLQEVERATCATEFLATRNRTGLGRERVECETLLAKARRGVGLIMEIAAV